MSAPSFSSFPSFGSFPDSEGDAGPSTTSRDKEASHQKRNRPKDSERNERKEGRKHRDREHKHDKSHKSKAHNAETAEGRSRPEKVELPASTSRPTFYSDRKGDTLNIKYGGLHAGDVPRYRPVGREFTEAMG